MYICHLLWYFLALLARKQPAPKGSKLFLENSSAPKCWTRRGKNGPDHAVLLFHQTMQKENKRNTENTEDGQGPNICSSYSKVSFCAGLFVFVRRFRDRERECYGRRVSSKYIYRQQNRLELFSKFQGKKTKRRQNLPRPSIFVSKEGSFTYENSFRGSDSRISCTR